MKNNTKPQGRCSCEEIRYELTESPLFVHCCHCHWCQRETGSAFAINALIEADHVRVTEGSPEQIFTPSNTGIGQIITRCPTCKTAIWSNYGAAKEAIRFIRVGTLDDPNNYPPDIHIFTSSKQKWVQLNNSIPAVAEYYKRSEYWSKKSITRYKCAIS